MQYVAGLLRDTLKHFPVDRSADEEEIEEGKGDGGEEEEEGGRGCCVLCERFMPLTRHHLIPRYSEMSDTSPTS